MTIDAAEQHIGDQLGDLPYMVDEMPVIQNQNEVLVDGVHLADQRVGCCRKAIGRTTSKQRRRPRECSRETLLDGCLQVPEKDPGIFVKPIQHIPADWKWRIRCHKISDKHGLTVACWCRQCDKAALA